MRTIRFLKTWLPVIFLTLGLFVTAEVGICTIKRLVTGAWPHTRVEIFYRNIQSLREIYRLHPFTNVGPVPGGNLNVYGKDVRFNRAGYRSPEFPGTRENNLSRVVCAGGSTTFDLLATNNAETWTYRLEKRLNQDTSTEVYNAGFPGWTTLENLIALAGRDLELEPDLYLLYQGINDLQPLTSVPPDPSYVNGHADFSRQAMGFDLRPPGPVQRLVLVETVRNILGKTPDPWEQLKARTARKPVDCLPEESLKIFKRNLISIVGITKIHEVDLLLVTQRVQIRDKARKDDLAYLSSWFPNANPENVPGMIQALNEVIRTVAREQGINLADAAMEMEWTDSDFGDPMHTSAEGSKKLAAFLTPHVRAILEKKASTR